MNNLYDYWSSLSESERERFARASGYQYSTINTHLIHKRKIPPLAKVKKLASASNGKLSYHGLCDFFVEDQQTEEA